jgi:hypothetical protein
MATFSGVGGDVLPPTRWNASSFQKPHRPPPRKAAGARNGPAQPGGQIAAAAVSPVRIRTTSARFVTKILPSPT